MKICHAVVLWVGVILIAGSLGQRSRDRIDDMINATNARFREAIELSVKHPLDVGPAVVDEATGTHKFPPPPGFTAEEFDAELTRLLLEDRQREGNRLPGEPTVRERIKAIERSRLSPAQLADLANFEKPESIATEESARAAQREAEPAPSGLMRALFNYGNLPLLIVNVGAIGTIAWILMSRWRAAGRGRS